MYDANRLLHRPRCTLWLRYLLTYIVKVHCNLRLVDKIEEIDHNDYTNIEWSSDEEILIDEVWSSNFLELYYFLNFF